MLTYYPTLYICDATTFENVYECGRFLIVFQEYSGGTFSNASRSAFISYLDNYTENPSALTCYFIAPDTYTDTPTRVFSDFLPITDLFTYPSIYNTSNYRYKLLFTDNGDSLISVNPVSTFSGDDVFYAYDNNYSKFYSNGLRVTFGYGYRSSKNITSCTLMFVKSGGVENERFKNNATFLYSPVASNVSYYYMYAYNENSDLVQFFNRHTANVPPREGDPYANAGDSTTGGGGGSWDNKSDPIPVPSLPSVGATNTGFISLFVPSQAQLRQVANYLWSSLFDISTFFKIFENPMDCILGLSVVPVTVPTSGNAQITVGNIELSGISLPLASQQYVEVNCGSLTITPYFGSYLDYEPYTKMSLFVPYSGVHSVNADDLMDKTVSLVYHIDILTGSLVAFVKCGDSVLYEFNGACGSNIPVNSVNYASTIENAIRIAVNIGTTVATAGASAPLSMGAEGISTAQNVARGISLAGSTAEGALSMKPNIDRAGSLGGTTGILGNQTPYFIVTRPRLCKPKDQNKIKGYPAFINYTVSELEGKGYTEFDTIILNGLYLTDDEKGELESVLTGGVYL